MTSPAQHPAVRGRGYLAPTVSTTPPEPATDWS
jgi:hypothetical protein